VGADSTWHQDWQLWPHPPSSTFRPGRLPGGVNVRMGWRPRPEQARSRGPILASRRE